MVIRISWSLLLLGAIVRIALRRHANEDLFVPIVWRISLGLGVAWVAIMILVLISMGYAATNNIVIGILSSGFVAGVSFGCLPYIFKAKQNDPDSNIV